MPAPSPSHAERRATDPARTSLGESLPSTRVPLFLHRDTYRRRRIMDAARLLPFLGTALLLLPMLWETTHLTSTGGIYVFLAWLGLIAAGAFMARRLSAPLREQARGETGVRTRGHRAEGPNGPAP